MADILPFRALRYDQDQVSVSQVVTQPYDKITPAMQEGYYAAEGLTVTFQNAIDADLVPKVGAGTLDLGLSDGTSVIPAVNTSSPIATWAAASTSCMISAPPS